MGESHSRYLWCTSGLGEVMIRGLCEEITEVKEKNHPRALTGAYTPENSSSFPQQSGQSVKWNSHYAATSLVKPRQP